jgi:hypothetical protein
VKPLGFPPRFGVLWLFLAPLVLFSGAGFLPLAIWFVVALSQAPELLLSCLRRERHGLVAQFEREMMLERQREGIAKAKSEARYKGRKPIEAERRHSVLKLAAEGATRVAIAAQIGIGEAAVYRIFAWIKPNPITERRFSLPDPRLLGALPVSANGLGDSFVAASASDNPSWICACCRASGAVFQEH